MRDRKNFTALNRNASSLADIIEAVHMISQTWAPDPSDPEELWFRGEIRSFNLLPGLYRAEVRALNYDEENLQERFKARGAPFIQSQRDTEWDWYFRSQHFGIPTRLLDWTESLINAVYFATADYVERLDRALYDKTRAKPRAKSLFDKESPVIWVLDAGSLNAFSVGGDSDCVLALGGRTDRYLPSGLRKRVPKNRFPIAILPPHSNERIVAQQGVFTIHGHDLRPINQLSSTASSGIRLARIILDRANLVHLWRELEIMGVTRASLFPHLESIAYVTKWFGQYPKLIVRARSRRVRLRTLAADSLDK